MIGGARLAPSFDAIRERLFAMARHTNGALVVSLMSRVAAEGVTTVTVGLAQAVARTRTLRTLLIDYDTGARSAGAALGVQTRVFAGWPGAADAAALSEAIVVVEPGRLDLLGLDAAVPSGFITDTLWAQAFAQLCAAYDVVLVDAGSAQQPLALRWSRIADLRLLVVDATRTTAEELERLKVELSAAEQIVDAVVLSKRSYHVPGFLYRHVR